MATYFLANQVVTVRTFTASTILPPTTFATNRRALLTYLQVMVWFGKNEVMGIGPGYDLAATGKCWNRGQIVQMTHNWSQRSWVINRANSVATRSMVKVKTSNLRFQIVSGRRPMSYVIAPPVVEYRG